jgi:hypothetical protein
MIGTLSDGFLVDFHTMVVVEFPMKHLEVSQRLLISTSFPAAAANNNNNNLAFDA